MKNAVLAEIFDRMADILEIQGENAFRVNSDRTVARVLRDMSEDVEHVHAQGRLTEIEGIGKSSAEKIAQFLDTGHMDAHDKLVAGFPRARYKMLRIPAWGRRRPPS